ncbi:MAG: SHOCT domain-containing protein [Acidimicrobiales bacterium]
MGRPGLVGTMARTAVVAGTATAVAGGVRNRQQEKAQQAEAGQQQQPAPPAAASDDTDITGELQKLAEMKSSGLLTDEEFAQAKAKLLG